MEIKEVILSKVITLLIKATNKVSLTLSKVTHLNRDIPHSKDIHLNRDIHRNRDILSRDTLHHKVILNKDTRLSKDNHKDILHKGSHITLHRGNHTKVNQIILKDNIIPSNHKDILDKDMVSLNMDTRIHLSDTQAPDMQEAKAQAE